MSKKFFILLTTIIISTANVLAHECHHEEFQKSTFKQKVEINAQLNERLNLTSQQQAQLRKNRAEYRKNINDIIEKMEKLHLNIRDIYYSGIPKFQADLKTASMKTELVLLKQNANKLREEHRKNFIKILTPEQKIEFQNFKKELLLNKHSIE